MSIESSLFYFVCLVLLLQILQKSIVTFTIIYKFGDYKEKEVKEVDTSRMGHKEIRDYDNFQARNLS